jgi:hypothetical protein
MKKNKKLSTIVMILTVILLLSSFDYLSAFEPSIKVCPKSDIFCKVKYNGIEVESEKGKDQTAIVIVN